MKLSRWVWGLAAVLLSISVTETTSLAASPAGRCARHASQPALPPAAFEDGPLISQADLVADFDGWMSGMRALNPDLSIRADLPTLDRQAARIRATLTGPMSRREAWEHFAELNPYLRDAHAGIQMPDYREALQAHLKAGGHVVPVEVRFAPDGSLRVFSAAPGLAKVKPGDHLLSINGHSLDQMLPAMMARSIGETPASQRAWVARRFAMLYFNLYGDTGQYDVVVQPERSSCNVAARAMGATILPQAQQPEPSAEEMFDWRILRGNMGYLRVDGFDGDKKDALAKVSQTAFAAFKARHVHALIIDVRENGGGDDPLWQQELVDHFTTQPYVQLSHFVQRITKKNADPGDVVGTIKSEDYDKRFTPPPVDPVRFNGPVYILAGPTSYSATIQFLVTAQDFGLAKIAGEETAALSCQTGQVTHIDMPKTGLSATTPLIAYTRPSGHGCTRGVMPDVPILIDEVKPDETLNALVNWVGAHRQGY